MNAIFAIALNAYREASRDRVLIGVFLAALASLLLGLSLAWLSLGETLRILVDHGVVTVSWLANLTSIVLGATFLYKEVELRTLYVVLAKPVGRWQFVLGKYLGIVATVWVFVALTASVLLVLVDMQAAESVAGVQNASWLHRLTSASRERRIGLLVATAAVLVGAGAAAARGRRFLRVREAMGPAFTMALAVTALCASAVFTHAVAPVETEYVLLACALVAMEVVVTAAIAMLFSSFSTPFVTGLLTLGMFLVGRSAGAMLDLRSRQLPVAVRDALRALATVLPNLQLYVPTRDALVQLEPGVHAGPYVLQAAGYAIAYATVLMLVAIRVFRRRDLQ